MRTLKFIVSLQFGTGGKLSDDEIESNLRHAIDKAIEEGCITPDDDGHAVFVGVDVTPI